MKSQHIIMLICLIKKIYLSNFIYFFFFLTWNSNILIVCLLILQTRLCKHLNEWRGQLFLFTRARACLVDRSCNRDHHIYNRLMNHFISRSSGHYYGKNLNKANSQLPNSQQPDENENETFGRISTSTNSQIRQLG